MDFYIIAMVKRMAFISMILQNLDSIFQVFFTTNLSVKTNGTKQVHELSSFDYNDYKIKSLENY